MKVDNKDNAMKLFEPLTEEEKQSGLEVEMQLLFRSDSKPQWISAKRNLIKEHIAQMDSARQHGAIPDALRHEPDWLNRPLLGSLEDEERAYAQFIQKQRDVANGNKRNVERSKAAKAKLETGTHPSLGRQMSRETIVKNRTAKEWAKIKKAWLLDMEGGRDFGEAFFFEGDQLYLYTEEEMTVRRDMYNEMLEKKSPEEKEQANKRTEMMNTQGYIPSADLAADYDVDERNQEDEAAKKKAGAKNAAEYQKLREARAEINLAEGEANREPVYREKQPEVEQIDGESEKSLHSREEMARKLDYAQWQADVLEAALLPLRQTRMNYQELPPAEEKQYVAKEKQVRDALLQCARIKYDLDIASQKSKERLKGGKDQEQRGRLKEKYDIERQGLWYSFAYQMLMDSKERILAQKVADGYGKIINKSVISNE